MSHRCRHCLSGRLDRHGSLPVRALRVEGGAVVRGTMEASRHLCRDCGRTTTVYAEDRDALRAVLRDHLAERVFAVGQSATSRETGLANSVIQRHLRKWAAPREAEAMATSPDFLLLETAHLRGDEAVMVADVDRETLVELLPSWNRLAPWLSSPGRMPATKACIPFDPRLASILRRLLPGVSLMVAPQSVRRAVRVEASLALRALRRRPEMRGRNGLPGPAAFAAALDGREEPHEGWPSEAASLLSAAMVAMEVAGAGSRARAEALMPELELACVAGGHRRLATLFSTWREEILEGADHPFVDGIAATVESVRRRLASRRPALGLGDLRAFVLLRDHERVLVPDAAGLSPPRAVSVGRPLLGLDELLSA